MCSFFFCLKPNTKLSQDANVKERDVAGTGEAGGIRKYQPYSIKISFLIFESEGMVSNSRRQPQDQIQPIRERFTILDS